MAKFSKNNARASLLQQNPWANLPADAHKFSRGHVLVIGGSAGKFGAPCLTALAALRSGAGWVSLALPEPAWRHQSLPLEFTFEDFFADGKIAAPALTKFLKERNCCAVVIGPGCLGSPLNDQIFHILKAFEDSGGVVVIDAGALQEIAPLLAKNPLLQNKTILTPHPGEWQKMFGGNAINPEQDEVGFCTAVDKLGVTVIYKSAAPIVYSAGGKISHLEGKNNKLARAGSGDVLAGMIGAHGAIGCDADFSAARSYVLLNAAANLAAGEVGEHGVIATDIIAKIGLVNQ